MCSGQPVVSVAGHGGWRDGVQVRRARARRFKYNVRGFVLESIPDPKTTVSECPQRERFIGGGGGQTKQACQNAVMSRGAGMGPLGSENAPTRVAQPNVVQVTT